MATPTAIAGLHVVPSQVALAGAEIELVAEQDREGRLRRALSALTGGFGYVLIDCPPSLGLLTLNALAASDQALVPLQAEYFALEGLAHLLYTLQLVRMNLKGRCGVGCAKPSATNREYPRRLPS